MKLAVIDTAVFVAGVFFWRHEPRLCLKAWLHGVLTPVMSEEIIAEYEAALEHVRQEQPFVVNTALWLDTLRTSALWVEPIPFEEKVCRDRKDNKFIEAALGERDCYTIISRDRDLMLLEKPFNIDILTPRQWLETLTRPQRKRLNG
jgi:putative PIN family toxin of toxin-antitoxin system